VATVLSIVTAFRNQYDYNRLFLENVFKYTGDLGELIAVDNGSADESGELFKSYGAQVIRNHDNCNYSVAMNQGSGRASGRFICHINNDVIVGPHWSEILIENLNCGGWDFVSPSSIELMPTYDASKQARKRWRRIQQELSSSSRNHPEEAWRKMYPRWKEFCEAHRKRYHGRCLRAINGHTVLMTRDAWKCFGGYDERNVASDWDLFVRSSIEEMDGGNLKAPRVCFAAYVHHFMGATTRAQGGKTLWANDSQQHQGLTEKWPMAVLKQHWWNPMDLTPTPTPSREPLLYAKYAIKRVLGLYQWGDEF